MHTFWRNLWICHKIYCKYKIFLMAVYMIFKYSKWFCFASSFNKHFLKPIESWEDEGRDEFLCWRKKPIESISIWNYQKHKTNNKRFPKKNNLRQSRYTPVVWREKICKHFVWDKDYLNPELHKNEWASWDENPILSFSLKIELLWNSNGYLL